MTRPVTDLAKGLFDPQTATRRQAAETLAKAGPDAAPAALALVQACADEDEQVRDWVVAALEELPAPAASEVSSLAKLLGEPNLDVAYWAATLLGRMGSEAAPAVSSLMSALSQHREPAVQQRSAWALGRIGASAAAAVGLLESAAASSDPQLARLSKAALTSIRG